ncbi:MAG: GNAT family N-acetyltransferase [Roseiflexaceae bacterium]
MPLTIRLLTEDDLDVADAILMPAYGVPRSRKRELRRYLALQPDGWLLALLDGEPAGLGGAIDYGPFAYIGLMAVHPALQHRGIATAILERLLAWIDARGCPVALLDASPAGAPLYEKFRFVDQDKALLFHLDDCALNPRLSDQVAPLRAEELPALAAFDAPIFGANRAAVLAAYLADYPDRAFVARDAGGQISGYLFAQAHAIGPWVAHDPDVAEMLLAAALPLQFAEAPRVIIPGANSSAAALLLRYGFSPQRALRHMRRGGDLPRQRALLYGQASFAIG